jgi:hypothetical protein
VARIFTSTSRLFTCKENSHKRPSCPSVSLATQSSQHSCMSRTCGFFDCHIRQIFIGYQTAPVGPEALLLQAGACPVCEFQLEFSYAGHTSLGKTSPHLHRFGRHSMADNVRVAVRVRPFNQRSVFERLQDPTVNSFTHFRHMQRERQERQAHHSHGQNYSIYVDSAP